MRKHGTIQMIQTTIWCSITAILIVAGEIICIVLHRAKKSSTHDEFSGMAFV